MAPSSGETHQLVAVFETHERAQAAYDQLRDQGIPSSEMKVLDQGQLTGESDGPDNLWDSIRHFFLPAEDTGAYHEGVTRGHAVLFVRPRPQERDRTIAVLDSFEPIDFDAQLETWRSAGWKPLPREIIGPVATRAALPPGTRVRGYVRQP